MALESTIEAYAVKRVKALGGFSLKTDRVDGQRFLDRTCFLPGGRVVVIEFKREVGGTVMGLQLWNIDRLRALGHEVYLVKTKEEIDAVLEAGATMR